MTKEEQSGHVKVTIDVEINEPLMEIMKKSMEHMPAMMKMMSEQKEKK